MAAVVLVCQNLMAIPAFGCLIDLGATTDKIGIKGPRSTGRDQLSNPVFGLNHPVLIYAGWELGRISDLLRDLHLGKRPERFADIAKLGTVTLDAKIGRRTVPLNAFLLRDIPQARKRH